MDWIDKHHLDTFAARRDAEDLLPGLVYELILATSETPAEARFLSGDAGRVRGFDGYLVSKGADPYVPPGRSVWEFGCEPTFKDKARRDLEKRTKNISEEDQRNTTFVFVTPRHYDTPQELLQDWEAQLAAGKCWRSVKVIDGGRLKHWLALAPGVAARWATGKFGAYPQGVRSFDEFWDEYSARFSVRLTEDPLLAGRTEQSKQLIGRLSLLQPDRLELSADSPDEALAFAVATVRKAPPEIRAVVEARSLVFDTAEAVTDLVRRGPVAEGMVFLPTSHAAPRAGLLAQRGPTVIGSGRAQPRSSSCIQLTRPPRHVFAQALLSIDKMERPRAMQLSAGCGRSVTVLARLLPGGSVVPPAWAEGPDRAELVPALLAGAWYAGAVGDRQALATLAGTATYEEWEARIQHLCSVDDPPLEQAGGVWKVRAPLDAFVRIGRFASTRHLVRFRDVCLDVLGELDANLELDEAALRMAGSGFKRSHWLREGLATTLLISATMHEPAQFGVGLHSYGGPEAWVEGIINDLPELSSDARLIASLQGALPLLAEAAPVPFASAVASLLDKGADAVALLFRERTAFLSPDARHIHLLWALEALAWDPHLLPRIAVLLARLAAIDPGGKLSNRPIASLRKIFLPWLPHTDADLDTRLSALAATVRTDERIGWELCLKLMPEHHSVSTTTSRPRIREGGVRDERPSPKETASAYGAVARHVLRLAGHDVERWCVLVKRLEDFPTGEYPAALEQLDLTLASAGAEDRRRLWLALQGVTARHASFQKAEWAITGEALRLLVDVERKWAPDDPVSRALPLFAEFMPMVARVSGKGPETREQLERRRLEALREIFAKQGEAGILRLVFSLTHAWDALRLVPEVIPSPQQALSLCHAALAKEPGKAESVVAGLSRSAHSKFGEAWRECVAAARGALSPSQLGLLLLGLPDDLTSWKFVDSFGSEVASAYWRRMSPWFPPETTPDVLEHAVHQLLDVGRPDAALVVIEDLPDATPDLVFRALDDAVTKINAAGSPVGDPLVHAIERVFEALANRDGVDPRDVARREYAYLPLLCVAGREKKPLVLFRLMAEDPTLFVSLLTAVFSPATGERPKPTDVQRKQAQAAFEALEAFRTVPGLDGGSSNAPALHAWVKEALLLAAEADRVEVGAQYVGKVLAHAPPDPDDGAWPVAAVREVIEEAASIELERGILIERFNMRGPQWKDPYGGGSAERKLAAESREWAAACAAWPRTAAMLAAIAEDWERHARHEDTWAQQRLMED